MLKRNIFQCVFFLFLIAGCGGNDDLGQPKGKTLTSGFLLGGPTTETAIFPGIRSNYNLTNNGAGFTVVDINGITEAQQFPLSVKNFQFADKSVSFDFSGNAGKIYRLYPVTLNRNPDQVGIGFQLKHLNDGMSMETLATNMLGSAESVAVFGSNPTNAQFLTTLYSNTLHRAPDQTGYNFWLAALNSGTSRASVVIDFSESAEHIASIAPSIAEGIEYIQYPLQGSPTQTAWAKSVTVGLLHSCALTSVGGVKCWGGNTNGQLGNGTATTSSAPVDVIGLTSGVKDVQAGDMFTCALTTANQIKCWGAGGHGQMGNGAFSASNSTPVLVSSPAGAIQPSAPVALTLGAGHACLLTQAGEVYCWGTNLSGQLANGSTTDAVVPVAVKGNLAGNKLAGVKKIRAGGGHTCVLTNLGGAKCFGANSSGQLGNGTSTAVGYAVDVIGMSSGVMDVTAAGSHGCVLIAAGTVKCWGLISPPNPTGPNLRDVPGVTNGIAFAKGGATNRTACVFVQGASLRCWGDNGYGQLGNWSVAPSPAVVTPAVDSIPLTGYSTSLNHTCAVAINGRVMCWGANTVGQLGTGQTSGSVIAKTNVVGFF